MMKRVALVAMLVAAAVAAAPSPASAYHRDRAKELQRLIDQKQRMIQAAEAKQVNLLALIASSDERRRALERQISDLDSRLETSRLRLSQLNVRLREVSARLDAKSAELAETLRFLDEQREELNRRVASVYISSPTSLSTALAAASNFKDVMDAIEFTSSVVRNDMDVVEAIEGAKLEIEAQRAEIDAQRAQVEADRDRAQQETIRIQEMRQHRAAAATEVREETSFRRRLLEHVRDQEAEHRAALRSYQSESIKIQEFLRSAQRGQGVQQGVGGWLKWPVSGPITSRYGWRIHPVHGYRSFHSGIDIGAGMGTPVKASRAGKVVYTGWNGAYGLVVMIDHGGSIATMYAHLSKVHVRPGENVGTLERVASVGSTGWSTGPHLHFEVRQNGSPVNPMRWL